MTSPQNPYIGPRAFQAEEKNQFYGRTREIRQLKSLLIAERLVLLHSPSGAGKTSLIHAGLLPEIVKEEFNVLPVVRVNTPPGEAAPTNRYIYSAILSLEEDATVPADERILAAELAEMDLDTYLKKRWRKPGAYRSDLLVFDQFEEILTTTPNDLPGKVAFFTQLGKALANTGRWALFAIREDYLGALAPYQRYLPGRLNCTFRLGLLGIEAAQQAVQKPAESVGVLFQQEAAGKLVKDLSVTQVMRPDGSLDREEGLTVEPVQLQVVCYRIFEANQQGSEEDARIIDEKDLAAAGDVDQVLGGFYQASVQQAVQRSGVSERSVRDWFKNELVSPGGIRLQVPKGAKQTKELDNRAVDALVDAHIVRSENRSNITWFELAHDRLIEPLKQNNDSWYRDHLQPFQKKCLEWIMGGKAEGLLLTGADLAQAHKDTETARTNQTLTAEEEEFIRQSEAAWAKANLKLFQRQAQTWSVENRPASLLLTGSALAQAESDAAGLSLNAVESDFLEASRAANRRVAREKRNQRLIRWLAIGAGIGMIVAMILAVVALFQSQAARQAQIEAFRQFELAEEARTEAEKQSEIAQANEQKAIEAQAIAEEAQLWALEQLQVSIGLRLAFQAQTLPLDQYESYQLSGLLAVESAGLAPGLEAKQSLRNLLNDPVRPITTMDMGTTVDVNAIDFSPDGSWVVSGNSDGSIIGWDAETGAQISRFDSQASVTYVAVSPDGTKVLSINDNKTAVVWDLETGTDLFATQPDFRISTAAFSPNDQWLALGSEDGFVEIADIANLSFVAGIEHTGPIRAVRFNSDGSQIVTGSEGGDVTVWDPGTGRVISDFRPGSAITDLAFHPNNLWVGVATIDGSSYVIDAANGNVLAGYTATFGMSRLIFSPDGQNIAAVSIITAYIFGAETGWESQRLNHDLMITSIAYSSDSRWIITGSQDTTARVWEVSSGKEIARVTHDGEVRAVAFHPSLPRAASAGADGTIRVWEIDAGQEVARFPRGGSITSLAFSPDGQLLATADPEGGFQIHNLLTQDLIPIPEEANVGWVTAIGRNDQAAVGGGQGVVVLWDIGTTDARMLEGHADAIYALAFNQQGSLLASGSRDGTARVWNTETGDPISTLETGTGIYALAFNPQGDQLVTGSEDGQVQVWDFQSPQVLYTLQESGSPAVTAVGYSPDGSRIVTGGVDNSVYVWDAQTGSMITMIFLDAPVTSVAFSPDGQSILTGSLDRTASVWEANTGKEMDRIVHEDMVNTAAYSPDGRWIATGTQFGNTRIWWANFDDLISEVCGRLDRNMYQSEWIYYLPDETYHQTCPDLPIPNSE